MAKELPSEAYARALQILRSANPLAHAWFKKAYDAGIRGDGWFAVKVGSEQDKAWRVYFAKFGWTPRAIKHAETAGEKVYTMPVEWPTWLPAGFSEGLV